MIASLLLLAVLDSQSAPDVPKRERQVLLELFAATRGESWRETGGWRSSAPVCDWYGVRCTFVGGDASRPSVEGLSLDRNNLSGTLPASLADLPHLGFLSVSGNRLRGRMPERLLERWDRHAFELSAAGNQFDNMVARAIVIYNATGALCGENDDLRYRLEVDDAKRRAVFQSVRCAGLKMRETYCLVREGIPVWSRALLSCARARRICSARAGV